MRETYQPPTISPAGPPHDHTSGASSLLPAGYKTRQNATECGEMRQKLVPARVRAYLLSAESQSAPNNRPRPHSTRAKRQNEKDEKCPPSSSITPQEQPKTPQTTRSSASPSTGGNLRAVDGFPPSRE